MKELMKTAEQMRADVGYRMYSVTVAVTNHITTLVHEHEVEAIGVRNAALTAEFLGTFRASETVVATMVRPMPIEGGEIFVKHDGAWVERSDLRSAGVLPRLPQ